MPNYAELEAAHLREPLAQPAHDDEQAKNQIIDCHHCGVTMVIPQGDWFDGWCGSCSNDVYASPEPEQEEDPMPDNQLPAGGITNKKTAAEAGTSTTVNEPVTHSNDDKPTSIIGHLAKPGKSTGEHVVTWGGERLPHKESLAVHVSRNDMLTAPANAPFHMCDKCVAAHDEDIRRRRAANDEARRLEREQAKRHAREQAIISKHLGEDILRSELSEEIGILLANGHDITPYLAALEELARMDSEHV